MKELSTEAKALLQQRERARATKDFALSDSVRDQLVSLGIEVRDTHQGQVWSWIVK